MKIIPVIDILDKIVVRGVAGNRVEYRPIESRLTKSVLPLEVAKALRLHCQTDRLYLADLDAIVNGSLDEALYEELEKEGSRLILDAGVQEEIQLTRLIKTGATQVVCGLESLASREFLRNALSQYGAEKIIFSLDMKQEQPITKIPEWRSCTAEEIATEVIEWGARELIVLDLADVGTGKGVSTVSLCQKLKQSFPTVKLITGGGVKTEADWGACRKTEAIDGLLVASAVHQGTLTPETFLD